MNFQSSKKFQEIAKNIIATTEAIGSISYARATYSEILRILIINGENIRRHPGNNFKIKYDVIFIVPTESHVVGNFSDFQSKILKLL